MSAGGATLRDGNTGATVRRSIRHHEGISGSMSECMDAAAAAAGTPDTLVPHKHGVDVHIDTAGGQWWELFARSR
jgi:hypothetical protein